jgi:hypothetical protein
MVAEEPRGLPTAVAPSGVFIDTKGAIMRVVRVSAALVIAFLVTCVVGVSGVSAQTNSVSFDGGPTLAFKGLAVNVTLDVTCDPSLNIAFLSASVGQVSGHKVAQGTGDVINNFPGVPCTGSAQTVSVGVPTNSSFAFKQGAATESADVTLFDPVSGNFTDVTAGPTGTRITK